MTLAGLAGSGTGRMGVPRLLGDPDRLWFSSLPRPLMMESMLKLLATPLGAARGGEAAATEAAIAAEAATWWKGELAAIGRRGLDRLGPAAAAAVAGE